MSARIDMFRELNQAGARLKLADDPELEVLIVGGAPSGNDHILATMQWIEEGPTSFPMHRYKGPITETDTGWLIADTREDHPSVSIDRLDEGMPEMQDQYATYQRTLPTSEYSQADLPGMVLDTVRLGGV